MFTYSGTRCVKVININFCDAISQRLTHPYYKQLANFIRALSFEVNAAEQKFTTLSPTHRVSLINGQGSI